MLPTQVVQSGQPNISWLEQSTPLMHNRKLQVRFHVVDRSMHFQLVLQHPSILYTDTQCIMALLGETATMNSHDFVYVGMNDAVEYISTEIYKHHLDLDVINGEMLER